jgi:hypothetical protein
MENVSVPQASVARIAQTRSVALWPMARIDRLEKVISVIARTGGKASTAMSAPLTMLAML